VTASPESDVSVKSGAGDPSTTDKRSSVRRAVGVVRVSRVGDRDGDRFVSPREQVERIQWIAERDGLKLLEPIIEELDVSGGTPLAKRHGLRRAVELVEAKQADVVVVAYFDRLVRSLTVQAEVVERIEQAGGAILAVDVGEVRADTASRWLSSTMLGLVAEYHRRATSERTADAKRRAVMRGVPPFPNVPPGYRQRKDGTLEPDRHADAVTEAFRLRARGATVMEVREHLRANGVDRSFHGVQALLRSRIPLGELRFGEVLNTSSHEPIVDLETWRRVQRQVVSRGRRPKSERLLARLGVLRCGTCGARMVTGTTVQGRRRKPYTFYRCNPTSDCPRRVTISADVAESTVVDAVKRILAGVEGTATSDTGIAAARAEAERAEAELDAAVRAFSGLDDVEATRERLAALRDARDAARDRLDDLQEHVLPAVRLTADDWDILALDERRDLIRAVVDRAVVAPGRGDDRVTVEARS
jgi:site-specific DNA recombinase